MVSYIRYTPAVANDWKQAAADVKKDYPHQFRRTLDISTSSQLQSKLWLVEELINLQPQIIHGFQVAAFDRDENYRFETKGGLHCIAAGMHWSPTDLPSLFYTNCNADIEHWKKDWHNDICKLEMKKIIFKDSVKDVPTLKQYLERNIH